MTTPLPPPMLRSAASITLTRATLDETSENTFSADRGAVAGGALASIGRTADAIGSAGRGGSARIAGALPGVNVAAAGITVVDGRAATGRGAFTGGDGCRRANQRSPDSEQ